MKNSVISVMVMIWLTALLGVAFAQSNIPGVIGLDNRRILQSNEFPSNAVGRVNVAGYKRTSLCTGTLIAPDKVITAAHCLFHPRTKQRVPINTLHFVAGKRGDTFAGHSKISDILLLPDYVYTQKRTTSFLTKDIALLKLATPLSVPPMMVATNPPNNPKLFHILYSRDRPYLPAIHEDCGVGQKSKALWATDCDTNFGGSGGPLLIEQNGKKKIAAVMVGINPGKASFAVPAHIWSRLLQQ